MYGDIVLENSNSYWNKELLPILLENEKVYLHQILKLIAEKYVSSIFGLCEFLLAFVIGDHDQTLDKNERNELGDFCMGLLNLDFVGLGWYLKNSSSFGHFVKFDFNLHISSTHHTLISSIFWDADCFKEMMLSQDNELKQYEDSFLFLNNKKDLNSFTPLRNFITHNELYYELSSDKNTIAHNSHSMPNLVNTSPEHYQNRCKELSAEVEKLKAENLEKDEKIKQLESNNLSADSDLLSMIFDESSTHRYAPDLVYAIRAWESIYIKNKKIDSHNNKANTWISKNTPYSGEQENGATRRLREIISPYIEWKDTRKKLLKRD